MPTRSLAVALAATAALLLSAASADAAQLIRTWHVNSAFGVAVNPDLNDVYVSERHGHRINEYWYNGHHVRSWGGHGSHHGQFNQPAGIAVAANGNLYVADELNHRVQEFTRKGVFIRAFSHGMQHPYGVTILPDGDVLVTDWKANRIQRFTSTGDLIGTFAHVGSPFGLTYAPASDTVYVTTGSSGYVVQFYTNGKHINDWGDRGKGPGQFTGFAGGVTTDAQGIVYVADTDGHRINTFIGDSTFLGSFGHYDYRDTTGGGLNHPWGIAASQRDGAVYVADQDHNRLKEFRR